MYMYTYTCTCGHPTNKDTVNSYMYIYIYIYTCIYIYLCRLAWVDQKRPQVLYQRYIRATQVLYQLPIKTSGENRQMKQLGIFAVVTIE